MTIQEHIKQLQQSNKEFKEWFDNDLPRIVGVEAVNFFTESFQNEGFTNQTLVPWKEVKRRENPRPNRAADTQKILSQSGNLGRSIEFTAEPGQVTIFSELDYAEVHNEGFSGTVSVKSHTRNRNGNTYTVRSHTRNVTIPKRQFIGDSETLDRKVEKIMEDGVKKILK